MAIQIIPYTESWIPAVVEFNERLRRAGQTMRFPESQIPAWLPPLTGRSIYQEYFLAVEGESVRGAYILKRQIFSIHGEDVEVGNLQLPISEGTVDRRYAALGLQLLTDALRRQPLLYSLGIGGYQQALAMLMKASGFRISTVPFLAYVNRPVRFCREIKYLRQSFLRRLALDATAFSGLAWGASRLHQIVSVKRPSESTGYRVERVNEFGTWADRLWDAVRSCDDLAAVRDREVLNILYPRVDPRFIILKLDRGDQCIGWTVLLATDLSHHKHFGAMRLGSIVDNLSLPGCEALVAATATAWLRKERVDLIVSNQTGQQWVNALRSQGFFTGPSNFLLALSRELVKRLSPLEADTCRMHFNRGDGDGPIHL